MTLYCCMCLLKPSDFQSPVAVTVYHGMALCRQHFRVDPKETIEE